jgi:exonuclease III
MRFGTWNVTSHYRSGSLTAAARESARYKLDLVGVQEVRLDKGGTVRAGDCNFFFVKKKKENHQLGTGFFLHHRVLSAVKRVEFF